MPLTPKSTLDIFKSWGIGFIDPFPSSNIQLYIPIAIDYMSKWVEATVFRNNDQQTVNKFLKEHILTRFVVLKPS